jgi:hypothetical protein
MRARSKTVSLFAGSGGGAVATAGAAMCRRIGQARRAQLLHEFGVGECVVGQCRLDLDQLRIVDHAISVHRGLKTFAAVDYCHGSIMGTPAASNGVVSRVATMKPAAAAVAAIMPSAVPMANPAARAVDIRRANSAVASRS